MRAYNTSSEETLRARKLLKDWASDGLITKAQYQVLEKETASDLRTTNEFLHFILFFFALISVTAAGELFLTVFSPQASQQTRGIFFVIFAAFCYTATEVAVARLRLYHYGVEEAFAVCSVGFLCLGMEFIVMSRSPYSRSPEFLIPAAGAIISLWIWHRFGLWYAFPAAMILLLLVTVLWTSSASARHLFVVGFYAVGLMCVAALRPGHRFDHVKDAYSLAEAFLWLGIYLASNLRLSALSLLSQWWTGTRGAIEFARPFYWATWVLIWCLPPVILTRGVRQKDRSVIRAGLITAILTFVTNKPYLGWPRHTWDPMILGILLTCLALFIQRWLARAPGGVRNGFTAECVSGKEKYWMKGGSAIFGLLSPHSIMQGPLKTDPGVRFGGGKSGGGGASGDF
ncbi:MAG: hypothetical protein JOY93_03605 [Acidobacteriales bacterium]|nr:hypothetical protein [Terriglobales bacterium]